MKHFNVKTIALLLFAVIGSAGCRVTTEQTEELSPALRTVVFRACEIDTKTTFGPGQNGIYPTLWTAGDHAVKLALNFTEAAEVAVIPDDGGRTASFTADINASQTQAPYTFYAVSPASAAHALSPSRKAWSISIPASQTPLEGSVDEAAQILAAASLSSDEIPAGIDLHFSHLTAYGRMTLKNLNLKGAAVDRIEITTSTPIVGDWYWECSDGHALTDNGASSTITLHTSTLEDIWFACAPVDMSGQSATITVFTDMGAFAKDILFPDGRKFSAGHIAVFSVDMSGSGPAEDKDEFRLLTDASTLKEGDQIIITNTQGTFALGEQYPGTKPYRVAAAVSVDYGVITDTGKAVILTLEAGLSFGTWALTASNGHICTIASGNNITAESGITANSSWKISITSSGEATVQAMAGGSDFLRYNSMTPRFSAYSSYSSLKDPVAIYIKTSDDTPAPVAEDPLTEFTEYGCYINGLHRTYVAGTDQYIRHYSQDGVQTFTLLGPNAKEQIEVSGYRRDLIKGDDVTVTLKWRKGFSTISKGTTYKLKVVKEDGPRVWLGKGNGEGFIIKK